MTQVPAYEAVVGESAHASAQDAAPAIPWPAVDNRAQEEALRAAQEARARMSAESTGHYLPQYGDARELLSAMGERAAQEGLQRGTDLVQGSGGADAVPGYRRTHVSPPLHEVHPDLAFASPEQQEAAARVAELAHQEDLARHEAARLEWDRQLQAQQQEAQEQLAQHQVLLAQQRAQQEAAQWQAQTQAQIEQLAHPEFEHPEQSLLTQTLQLDPISHEPAATPQLGGAASVSPGAADAAGTSVRRRDDDPWAGAETVREETPVRTGPTVTWSTGRASGSSYWGTASVWLITVTPWLVAAAVFVAFTLFEPGSPLAWGVLGLPWLIGILWAQQDAARLRALGHDRATPFGWAALTTVVYMVLRTLAVVRESGRGWIPLVVFGANLLLVVVMAVMLLVAPGALPAYLVTPLQPLRDLLTGG